MLSDRGCSRVVQWRLFSSDLSLSVCCTRKAAISSETNSSSLANYHVVSSPADCRFCPLGGAGKHTLLERQGQGECVSLVHCTFYTMRMPDRKRLLPGPCLSCSLCPCCADGKQPERAAAQCPCFCRGKGGWWRGADQCSRCLQPAGDHA